MKKISKIQGDTGHLEQTTPQAWRFKGNELKYIKEVMAAGVLSARHGKMSHRFERAFAEKMGSRYAIAVNSGTSTLHCAVAAAGVGTGDEVILPALTIICSAAAVVHHNGVPVMADIDPRTFNIDPADIERKITPRTKAIMVVPLCGLPCDMDPIMELAKKRDLVVIEDSAQSMLSTYKGKTVGTIGHIGSFSFEQTKHMTTGDGGMLVTDNEAMGTKMRQLSCHGVTAVTAANGVWSKGLIHEFIGWNYRMPELCSAVGLAQLERLDKLVALRVRWAQKLLKVIGRVDWLVPQYVPPECTHSYYSFMFTFEKDKAGFDRIAFDKACAEEGVKCGPFARPIYFEPGLAEMRCYGHYDYRLPQQESVDLQKAVYKPGLCPKAEEVQAKSINIMLYFSDEVNDRNVKSLDRAIKKCMKNR